MEGFERYRRAGIPTLKCGEMQGACIANADQSAKLIPQAVRQYNKASQDYIDWTKSMGDIELGKRLERKVAAAEQIVRHESDKRHWLERTQAWRQCLVVHPELSAAEVGVKCSHGYVAPMCVIDRPVLKSVPREPGEDDE